MGMWCLGPRARYGWTTMVSEMLILLQTDVFFYDRAGVSRFYFRCFQNATGSSSGPNKVPELRIELEATIFHAGGPEIG